MDPVYYETITKLEEMGADAEYLQGWVGGFLHNPQREEQRVTEGYTAGYTDGEAKNTDNVSNWVK